MIFFLFFFKSFSGYVIKFVSDKGKSKFSYTVRVDINL